MKPDVILAFSFGGNDEIDIVNWRIGARAKRLAQKYNAPMVIQAEIINKAAQVTPFNGGDYEFNPIVIGSNTAHLSTFQVILEFSKFAEERGWKKVSAVAAPPHCRRCIRDLKKFGFEIFKDSYNSFKDYSIYVWYNIESSQWWTRSLLNWWIREIPLRLLPWRIYKKIARSR
ncbi:hypothetical protein HZB04_01435 [Candidatus Wolfebacteria bacterium]|nr:hypothetical protein [Candidatus Wolfebacteria bacterium]